jgi:hypothetical protein
MLIQVTKKYKGAWWNKFINSYFLVKDKDTSYEVVFFSNKWGNNCGDRCQESNIPKDYCNIIN